MEGKKTNAFYGPREDEEVSSEGRRLWFDPYLITEHVNAFKRFVEGESGCPFDSFSANAYTEKQEGYKQEIYRKGRERLAYDKWNKSMVGNGDVLDAVISAIEIDGNNLVQWDARYGPENREHRRLIEVKLDPELLHEVEMCLFRIYTEPVSGDRFEELANLVGKRYPLLAYLFFLRDRGRFLPLRPLRFENALGLLGLDMKLRYRCSWGNYEKFLKAMGELKDWLYYQLRVETTLLDAHSFAWILGGQMKEAGELPDVSHYNSLGPTERKAERKAVINARVGQGKFREQLIEYWGTCAVTSVSEPSLLRASHIIPWAQALPADKANTYNGLLLAPNLDAAFDSGYISFESDGSIMISSELSYEDCDKLGVRKGMRLCKISEEHQRYLSYHRENVFRGYAE